jgi:hypothetical protein
MQVDSFNKSKILNKPRSREPRLSRASTTTDLILSAAFRIKDYLEIEMIENTLFYSKSDIIYSGKVTRNIRTRICTLQAIIDSSEAEIAGFRFEH